MKSVRIVSTPSGQAPLQVREAWVGLELPLSPFVKNQPVVCSTYGVLDDFDDLVDQPMPNYIVEVDDAISVLEAAHPDAAEWWRQNTPYLFGGGEQFAFEAQYCTAL